MEKVYGNVLTREQLIKKYNLSEDDQGSLLDTFLQIEDEMYKFLSYHV